MYKHLDTNIPKTLMRYNNFDFDKNLPLFPPREAVLSYVQEYTKPIEDYIRYNSEVQSVYKQESGKWAIEYRDYTEQFPKGSTYKEEFDAIILATGHYSLPFIPNVPGIKEWSEKYPGHIQHSKYYNDPVETFEGKTVLIVGNSASGLDISMQAANHAKKVYRSIIAASEMPYAHDPRIQDIPAIEKFDADSKTIILREPKEDAGFDIANTPKTLKDIDIVIYCTGYLYNFPFMKTYMDESDPNSILSPSGKRINRVYKQIFYIPDPSVSFINMTRLTVPFPLSEIQSAVIARVYSGRLKLPSTEEMLASERAQEIAKNNLESEFHNLPFPEDTEYYKELENWIKTGVETNPESGFFPEPWDDEKVKLRKISFDLKKKALEEKVKNLAHSKL